MNIKNNINQIKQMLPEGCELIVVSKTQPVDKILEAYDTGHRAFGENKVQELIQKAHLLPTDIQWHLIGHLQTNKVKYIAPFIYLIHSVDSLKLLQEINKQALKANRTISCLLQVYIANEETKFGLSTEEVSALLQSEEFRGFNNIAIKGLMGMASLTAETEQIRSEFKNLASLFVSLKNKNLPHCEMEILSMGMSGDFQIATEEGSNMVRVGSAIFGERFYHNSFKP